MSFIDYRWDQYNKEFRINRLIFVWFLRHSYARYKFKKYFILAWDNRRRI